MATSDFPATPYTLIFPTGSGFEAMRCVDVFVINDNDLELSETFFLNLTVGSGSSIIGSDDTITVTIVDDDGRELARAVYVLYNYTVHAGLTVSIPAMTSVGEGDGMVQVCITLETFAPIARDFTVTLTASDDTGIYRIN